MARYLAACLALVVCLSGFVAAPAGAAAGAPSQAAQLLQGLEQGGVGCSGLTAGQLESVGDFVMRRLASSPRLKAMVDLRLRRILGAGGGAQVRVALGRRLAGCQGHLAVDFDRAMKLWRRAVGQGASLLEPIVEVRSGAGHALHDRHGDGGFAAGGVALSIAAMILALLALSLLGALYLRPRRHRSRPA